jgi:acetyl esterase/lipase
MPLDPHVQQLVNMMIASGNPPLWQLTPAEARIGADGGVQALDAKDVPIGKIENGQMPGPGGPLPYRVYTPVDATGAVLPGLVYLHGGGFVIGSLETHDGFMRLLANASGCRIVAIAYRLAPEHKFPAAVEDAYAALKWVADHAGDFGIDAERLAIGGDSAGGNLAAVACQLARQAGGPSVRLQLLLCPYMAPELDTDSRRTFADGPFIDTKAAEWFSRHYYPAGTDFHDPRVTPLWAEDFSGLPEAHIHTAECDMLRDDGYDYAGRLQKAGVKVRYTCHPGMMHHFYGMSLAIPYALVAVKEIGAAVKDALA